MRLPRFVLPLVLVSVGTTACLLFSDLDRLSNGAALPDDASGDTGTTSDTGALDATGDGCGHAICEDFDDEASLTSWRIARAGQAPLFGVDDRAFTTPPSSFFYEATEPLTYGTITSISKLVPVGPKGGVTCTFDLRIDAYDGSFMNVFALGVPNEDPSPTIALEAADDGLNITQEPGGLTRRTDMTPIAGTWTKLTVTFRRSPVLEFSLGDGFRTVTVQPKAWPDATEISLSFGLVYSRFASERRKAAARFDTIRCDAL